MVKISHFKLRISESTKIQFIDFYILHTISLSTELCLRDT
jgi:hypothetical protein